MGDYKDDHITRIPRKGLRILINTQNDVRINKNIPARFPQCVTLLSSKSGTSIISANMNIHLGIA
jgi:hypothetical protein